MPEINGAWAVADGGVGPSEQGPDMSLASDNMQNRRYSTDSKFGES